MKQIIYLFSLMGVFLSGCHIRVLNPKSDTAEAQSFLIYFSFGIMILVLLTVFSLLSRFVRKYRNRTGNHQALKHEEGNKKLEIVWTIIPVLLLAILAIPTVIVTYNQSPNQADQSGDRREEVHINVTAEQYQWTFIYENGKTTSGELYLPSDKTIVLHLRSKDVIHSFWVPSIGGKVDVLPHKENTMKLENIESGVYQGKCAEFCGTNHTDMRFTTRVISSKQFLDWLDE